MILTGQTALAILRKVVFEKGADYVYPHRGMECVNFENGQPSCIVGHVFAELGITYEQAVRDGFSGSSDVLESVTLMEQSPDQYDWEFDNQAVRVLSWAQAGQGSGRTWGEALQVAEEFFAGE